VLTIVLQSTDDNGSFDIGEELGTVGEVLDDPEGQESCHYCYKTFQDKDPRPARFPTDPGHLRDRGLSEVKSMGVLEKTPILRTASKPPKAPDTEAAEKKSATRKPSSERLYQLNGG
jgi:hypothetical protein